MVNTFFIYSFFLPTCYLAPDEQNFDSSYVCLQSSYIRHTADFGSFKANKYTTFQLNLTQYSFSIVSS